MTSWLTTRLQGWVSSAGRYNIVVMRFKRGVITELELDNC